MILNKTKVSFTGRACRIVHSVLLLGCILLGTLQDMSFLLLAGWIQGLFAVSNRLGGYMLMIP